MARTTAWNVIRRDLRHFGLLRTLVDVCFRAANCLVCFRVVRAFTLTTVKSEFLDDRGLNWRFLSDDELRSLADEPANEITADFLEEALAKGDRCYAATVGEKLVTYVWLSHLPTNADGLYVHFNSDYVYAFKAFANPEFRGGGLNSVCIHRALEEYLRDGFPGFIADIDVNNFASLHGAERMGFEPFGLAVLLKIGRQAFIHVSRGARQHGYYFADTKRRRRSDRKAAQEAVV